MSDELLLALERAKAGDAPSPFGKLELVVPGAPVSVQSSKAMRDAYLEKIRSLLAGYKYVLTGQSMLEVVWRVSAKSRYETDAKADIDNCLKPIIDAFTGPGGLFINDCQLKALYICWRSTDSGDESLVFNFEYDPEQYCRREGLAFLKLQKGLCFPVDTTCSKGGRLTWASAMCTGRFFKASLEKLGVPYLAVASMQGGQPFHITRTGGFPLLTEAEFIAGDDKA